MGFLKQMKDMKNVVSQAPAMVGPVHVEAIELDRLRARDARRGLPRVDRTAGLPCLEEHAMAVFGHRQDARDFIGRLAARNEPGLDAQRNDLLRDLVVDERLVADLIQATRSVAAALGELPPI